MTPSRRSFMMSLAATGAALASTRTLAQTPLDPKDPTAVALGYVADTTQADAKKYPAHTDSLSCSNCVLYQGKPGDAGGPCPLFVGKQVNAKGWCSAWAKKG